MHDCQNDAGKYIGNTTQKQNLNLALSDLISHSTTWFYNSTADEGLDKVYALFYCRVTLDLTTAMIVSKMQL